MMGKSLALLKDLYFGFRGEISREPYVLGWLFLFAVQAVIFSQMMAAQEDSNSLALLFLAWAFTVGLSAIALLIMSMKRARDIGWPPVVGLAMIIPAFSMIGLLIFSVMPSKRRDPPPTIH